MIKKQKFSFIKYKPTSIVNLRSSSKTIADFRPALALENGENVFDSKSEEKNLDEKISQFRSLYEGTPTICMDNKTENFTKSLVQPLVTTGTITGS